MNDSTKPQPSSPNPTPTGAPTPDASPFRAAPAGEGQATTPVESEVSSGSSAPGSSASVRDRLEIEWGEDHLPAPPPIGIESSFESPKVHPAAPIAPAKAERSPLWIRALWWLVPFLLLLAGSSAVMLTQRGVGYAWDEAYYYQPALKAADWLGEALRGQRPFDQANIEKYWEERHEHPSVQKFLSGLSLKAFPDPAWRLSAMRLPIAILFGLSLSLIYLLGRQAWGPAPGLIAALLYATLPRLFGQAHFASMETPLDCMMLLTVFCFLRGLVWPLWAGLTGVSFGLLLATKLNGFFLPIPLVLWGQLYARRRYGNNLFAMLTLGPLVFVAAWPWLWHDTAMRILEYLAFHARHQLTAVYYLGQVWGYGNQNAPWHYPLVMIAVTVPVTGLALMGWGLARTLAALRRQPIGALYLLCVLVMLGVASAPSTPKYDGVRLFSPVFPFLALLGGSGAAGLLEFVRRRVFARRFAGDGERLRLAQRWAVAALALLVVLDGASAILRYQPYFLSYFNPLVGGLPGARRLGFETTYWGEALNEDVIAALNRLPDGTKLMPLALHELCLQHLQQWGVIKPGLKIGGEPPYDAHLLLMRQGFYKRPERALAEPNPFPGHIWYKAGVPLIGLYQTGPAFELYWPNRP